MNRGDESRVGGWVGRFLKSGGPPKTRAGTLYKRTADPEANANFSINFWKHLNILKKYTRDVHITTKHIFMLIYAYRHVERKDMRLRGWWCWWVWCRTDRGEGRGESVCDIPGFPVWTWLWYSVSHSGWNRVDTAECTFWCVDNYTDDDRGLADRSPEVRQKLGRGLSTRELQILR